MSARKTLSNAIDSNRQSADMDDRRMDSVRKNFAVGVHRIVAARGVNGGSGFNRKIKSAASGN